MLNSDQTDVTMAFENTFLYDNALKMGRAGYMFYNPDTKNFQLNSSFIDEYLTEEEIQIIESQGFWPLVHKKDLDNSRELWNNAIDKKIEFERVIRISTAQNGDLWFRVHAHPYLRGFACFFVNVSEQIITQRKLEDATKRAEKALHDKNYILGRLSHEIRTPMNAVTGISDALIHHNSDESLNSKLELIQTSADSILRILDRTLESAKIDSETPLLNIKLGNPAQTVTRVCQLWQDRARNNRTVIEWHIDQNVPEYLKFDKHRYEQCLNNLLSNAIKFTQDGKIKVILMTIEKKGSTRLVLAVRDSGIGMTEKQQSRIFEAFQQADHSISERYGGTGLGMHITKQLADLMGGGISVRSAVNQGSVFALWIPLDTSNQIDENDDVVIKDKIKSIIDDFNSSRIIQHANLNAPVSVKSKVKAQTKYSDLNVLVADDNPTNHVVVQSILEGTVGKIFTANNGQNVLDILALQHIDIILMDIHMPVMDGIETTLAIRSSNEAWKNVSIIALTADPQYQQKRICLNIGMNEALGKPVKVSEILNAFDTVLDEKKSSRREDIELELFQEAV